MDNEPKVVFGTKSNREFLCFFCCRSRPAKESVSISAGILGFRTICKECLDSATIKETPT